MPPPAIYGNKSFTSSVVDMLKNLLPCAVDAPVLDGDSSRNLLMFNDGQLIDLRTGLVRPGQPHDRISRTVGYATPDWQAAEGVKGSIRQLVDDMHKCFRVESGMLTDDLKDRLDQTKNTSGVLEFFWGLFEDWDMAVWLLRQSVRALAAAPTLEEFTWMSNVSGSNGKGTWIALMKAAIGQRGFFYTLDFSEFMGTRQKGNHRS